MTYYLNQPLSVGEEYKPIIHAFPKLNMNLN